VKNIITCLALVALAAACDSPTQPAGERYVLISLNAVPLPAPHPEQSTVHVVSGQVVLRGDVIEETITVACRPDLPVGTTCQLQNGGRMTRRGTFSREEGWIRFGAQQYAANFAANMMLVDYAPPPSAGVFPPRLLHRFQRPLEAA
jgi:hypothetical protein